jgi:uncharacterized protein (TIGR00255 family)
MNSMTGHGRAVADRDGIRFAVEISSVNRKQCEVIISLPRELGSLENPLRAEVLKRVSRGRVSVYVVMEAMPDQDLREVQIDRGLAVKYARAVEHLRNELGWNDSPLEMDLIFRLPQVIQIVDPGLKPEIAWPVIEEALGRAMEQFIGMRMAEGEALKSDLAMRVDLLDQLRAEISLRRPDIVTHYRDALTQRIEDLGVKVEVDDDKLAREVAYFADKSDISEELTRLESHLAQMRVMFESTEPVGRSLEFLLQELNREFNTIASKASDANVSQAVVTAKTEMERIREQIQNIE